ncbi:hypothetical protein HK097_007250 [Rhizophlyctis rosea]|uniref:Checkpoint protein n=1 Tax=Rhizophlyctis rosea TaxID=64517 RepID=A0AAD5SJR6_9FUNG|nr:hypothetical protein HK097_007250 [Rhizophlyctis rosea]
MRLSATLINAGLLTKMAMCLEKITKRWIMQFGPEHIHLLAHKEDITTGAQMFGQIKADRLFEKYVVECRDDSIYLEFSGEHLVRALKSGQQATEVSMKLLKPQGEDKILRVIITNQGRSGKPIKLTHDIPVRQVPESEAADLHNPTMIDYQVHILLPKLPDIRSITERMRAIAPHITLSANMAGTLILEVQADSVHVQTFFHNLEVPAIDSSQVDEEERPALFRDTQYKAAVRLDIRDFLKFLQCSIFSPKHVICCIAENNALMMYVYLGDNSEADDGAFIYYLPHRFR